MDTMYTNPYGLQHVGEVLPAAMEEGNEEDRYAIAILKGGIVVGHANSQKTFYFFLGWWLHFMPNHRAQKVWSLVGSALHLHTV